MSKPTDQLVVSATLMAELFTFDPLTGVVTRRVARGGRSVGVPVGRKGSDGYLRVGVNKRTTLVHRIAWCLHHGRWPVGVVDHINGVVGDNRIENLREVTQQQNLLNQHALRPSKLGIAGASAMSNGRFRARLNLTVNGKRRLIHLGVFDSAQEAGRAYQKAKAAALRGEPCY